MRKTLRVVLWVVGVIVGPAALALADARNPYTGEAFQWVAARSSIAFTGLQKSTNRYTEFLY